MDVVNNHARVAELDLSKAPDDSVVTMLFARDDHYISTAMGDVGPGTVTVNDATGEISWASAAPMSPPQHAQLGALHQDRRTAGSQPMSIPPWTTW